MKQIETSEMNIEDTKRKKISFYIYELDNIYELVIFLNSQFVMTLIHDEYLYAFNPINFINKNIQQLGIY